VSKLLYCCYLTLVKQKKAISIGLSLTLFSSVKNYQLAANDNK